MLGNTSLTLDITQGSIFDPMHKMMFNSHDFFTVSTEEDMSILIKDKNPDVL